MSRAPLRPAPGEDQASPGGPASPRDPGRRRPSGPAACRARRRGVTTPRAAGRPEARRPPPKPAKARPRDLQQWARLASAIDVRPVSESDSEDPAVTLALVARARRQAAQSTLAEALAVGEPLERAVCRAVADLVAVAEWNAAWAMAEGAGRLRDGATASTLGHAVLLHRRRLFDRLWTLIQDLDDKTLAGFIPVEAVDGALASGTDAARQRASAIAAAAGDAEAAVLVDLAGRFLAFGEKDRARDLVAELRRRPDRRARRAAPAQVLEPDRGLARPHGPVPTGAVPVGVIQYLTPRPRCSPPATSATTCRPWPCSATWCGTPGCAFTGEDGLGDLASELQDLVRPDLRLPGIDGVHAPGRASSATSAASPTSPSGPGLFAFGWHMHPLFDLRYDFPTTRRSARCSCRSTSTGSTCSATRRWTTCASYGPVGCRDWTTVYLLLSAGVDAFFSGCLTTTVDAVFPDARRGLSAAAARSASSTAPAVPRAAGSRGARGIQPPVGRVPLHVRGRGRPARPAPGPGGLPARPRPGRHPAPARLPAADLARGPGPSFQPAPPGTCASPA